MEFLLRPPAAPSLSFRRIAIDVLGRSRSTTQQHRRTSVCPQCQWRAVSVQHTRPTRRDATDRRLPSIGGDRRHFVTTAIVRDRSEKLDRSQPLLVNGADASSTVRIAPAEDLPSHTESRKWSFTKRMNQFMDQLLARLSIAGHEINKYTGTDYSGIEALRREIKGQEELVKTRHEAVNVAKTRFDEAQTLQMASNKEVVALLERKNSWTSTDLDRYMSIIRSEHVNEQNVSVTRDALLDAERGLEEARSRLERRERAQYHEEQIWSDTIRRNSTWVTFGLMGFNVVLLLANIGVVEPWRRQRMVREIKASMDERAQPLVLSASTHQVAAAANPIDEIVATEVVPEARVEGLEATNVQPMEAKVISTDTPTSDTAAKAPLEDQIQPDMEPVIDADSMHPPKDSTSTLPEKPSHFSLAINQYERFSTAVADLFSPRLITLRKVDITAVVLGGTATGAALVAGVFVFLLRTR